MRVDKGGEGPKAASNQRVAIQGERGSYSEEAAARLLKKKPDIYCCEHFHEIFAATASGQTRYCAVPVENSLAGSIHKNYDLFSQHQLHIVREVNLRIEHNLIGAPGSTLKDIKTVMSHPVALDQCGRFFKEFPGLLKQSSYDTSGSVKRIVEEGWSDCAAIAGRRAAEHYGGKILMSAIEDNSENFTRFLLLAAEPEIAEGADKTSIVFSFQNAPGALSRCLSVFALRDIDLTKIESRPIHGRPWEYLFYLDFLGDVRQEKTQNALNHLKEITEFLEVLGCYPRDPRLAGKSM